tara:strand:- start:5357 stop:5572 length:216 start_codon:yes stop_codon:yes gene_type:complete
MRIEESKENYVAVTFKGAQYICVENSQRARLLNEAEMAWRLGYDDMCVDLHLRALKAPGCALEHRLGVRHA